MFLMNKHSLGKGNLWKEDILGSQFEEWLCQQKDFQSFVYEQLKF